MSRFKQMESFVAVAHLGTLSAAARAEGVAPAVIGRRMDALEERLGVKLLARSTRKLSLTSEGEAFLVEAQRILLELEEAETRIGQGSARVSGHLRLSAPAGFGRRHVAQLLTEFAREHPDLSFTLDLTDRLVDLIKERYDLAIRIGELTDSQMIGLRLADNRRLIVASPAYLAHYGRPNVPDDLAHHLCLSFGNEQGNQSRGWLLRVDGEVRPVRVQGRLACSDGSVLHQWALDGLGLSWRSWWEVHADLAAGRLVSVLDEYAAPPSGIFAVLPERRHLPLRVRLLVDRLKACYHDPDYWRRTAGLPDTDTDAVPA